MRVLVLLISAVAAASASIKVPIVRKSVWRQNENGVVVKRMAAVCTFVISEVQFQGDWEVNITLNKPTKDITVSNVFLR